MRPFKNAKRASISRYNGKYVKNSHLETNAHPSYPPTPHPEQSDLQLHTDQNTAFFQRLITGIIYNSVDVGRVFLEITGAIHSFIDVGGIVIFLASRKKKLQILFKGTLFPSGTPDRSQKSNTRRITVLTNYMKSTRVCHEDHIKSTWLMSLFLAHPSLVDTCSANLVAYVTRYRCTLSIPNYQSF